MLIRPWCENETCKHCLSTYWTGWSPTRKKRHCNLVSQSFYTKPWAYGIKKVGMNVTNGFLPSSSILCRWWECAWTLIVMLCMNGLRRTSLSHRVLDGGSRTLGHHIQESKGAHCRQCTVHVLCNSLYQTGKSDKPKSLLCTLRGTYMSYMLLYRETVLLENHMQMQYGRVCGRL